MSTELEENVVLSSPSAAVPTRMLCVDLDGTLLATDVLWESLLALLKSRPLREKVREVEEAGAYVERVAAALKDREAEHEQRRAFLRQLPAARKELAELAELLG